MAALMLESLVLRGLVLRGEKAVELRRGTSVRANCQATGMDNSLRSTVFHWPLAYPQVGNDPDVDSPTSGVMPGAGRSRRQIGSPAIRGCMRTIDHTTPVWLRSFPGGQAKAAVAKIQAIPACLAASVAEILPPSRTPPSASRGMAVR